MMSDFFASTNQEMQNLECSLQNSPLRYQASLPPPLTQQFGSLSTLCIKTEEQDYAKKSKKAFLIKHTALCFLKSYLMMACIIAPCLQFFLEKFRHVC